ncbi:hypothetical protein [Hyphomonas pacifica]|uniref:Uncharacterized protein n=1 Tax=Hyphomonas pacifica TaxID=1280941 RepID=A0A062TP58_9PROT|nr:hypothetical protein [Hyphomonas pacifica]KCZ47447.1 hypothetical protein HY2_04845 [Hyphomonas pacifica]RAN31364.1 hypothetical protein HY3_04545 [Hyphomonas pacifica]
MGTLMTRAGVLSRGKAPAPTPLLVFIAGPHAGRVAHLWPAPHAGFFALPTARRHAAAILLQRRWTDPGGMELDVVHAVERARDADLARILMRGEAPGGLMKALGRLGEALWQEDAYDAFLALFADPEAVTVLRHMPQIEADQLTLMQALPSALRVPGIIGRLPERKEAAEDLADAYALARRIHGAGHGPHLVKRWQRAATSVRLFDMAAEALQPAEFGFVLAPPRLPAAFHPVRTRKALAEIALEFHNCLRDFAADLSLGRMAVYAVREGGRPPVALALRQDPAGWRLAEAKLARNADVEEPHLRHLVGLLEGAGVRTGESSWTLADRLHKHACPHCGPAYVPHREDWRAGLMLGSLWD